MTKIKTLAIVGVGLIGGSLALALKSKGAVARVLGVGRSRANLDEALELKIIDAVASIEEAAKADVIFVATPVAQMPAVFAALKPYLCSNTVITDGGSTKQDVVAAARKALGEKFSQFVPAHPIAGTEKTGAAAAFATLYEKRKIVVCREAETNAAAIEIVETMWRATGAEIHAMTAENHDDIFAAVSHLPHLLAFALVDMLARLPPADDYFKFAASGFRDFTRIAGGSPEMWRDITVANRNAIRQQLAIYRSRLDEFDLWLAETSQQNVANIETSYARASAARNAWQRHIEYGEPMPKLSLGGQVE
jgi:prephenate dehydrogenase